MSLLRNGCSTFGSAFRAVPTRGKMNKSFGRGLLVRPFSAGADGQDQKRAIKDDDALAEGEILLYKGSQLKPILLMLSVSAVNVMVSLVAALYSYLIYHYPYRTNHPSYCAVLWKPDSTLHYVQGRGC